MALQMYGEAGYETLNALRRREVIDLCGMKLRMYGNGIVMEGYPFVGATDTVDLYECYKVRDGLIYVKGREHPFELDEGVFIEELRDQSVEAAYVVPEHLIA